MKYRIIRIYKDGEWWYCPQAQKSFLFFKYWKGCSGLMYLQQHKAKEIIESHAKNDLVKSGSVVWQGELES